MNQSTPEYIGDSKSVDAVQNNVYDSEIQECLSSVEMLLHIDRRLLDANPILEVKIRNLNPALLREAHSAAFGSF